MVRRPQFDEISSNGTLMRLYFDELDRILYINFWRGMLLYRFQCRIFESVYKFFSFELQELGMMTLHIDKKQRSVQ